MAAHTAFLAFGGKAHCRIEIFLRFERITFRSIRLEPTRALHLADGCVTDTVYKVQRQHGRVLHYRVFYLVRNLGPDRVVEVVSVVQFYGKVVGLQLKLFQAGIFLPYFS